MTKAALITGASSGIGAATAIEFGKNGYFVYLMGRDKDRLQEVAAKCRAGASLLSCDLLNSEAVTKRLEEAFSNKIHKIEVLVNNAGIYESETIEAATEELWERQLKVNLLAPVRLTRAFLPYFKAHGGGSIVNVSSTLGLRPQGPTSAYSASKAALVSFTQSTALEGAPHKIRANCICPGLVQTPIHGTTDFKKLQRAQPLGRTGTSEEIAKSIFFIGSESSAWTTGAVLSVDGGINL